MIRLVIVDDMPDIRNYLAEELAAASEQFSVVGAAEDGTEAVKLVAPAGRCPDGHPDEDPHRRNLCYPHHS